MLVCSLMACGCCWQAVVELYVVCTCPHGVSGHAIKSVACLSLLLLLMVMCARRARSLLLLTVT